MRTIGIVLGRFQPVTQVHIDIIFRASKSNDEAYIFVAGNKLSRYNPLPFEIRKDLILRHINYKNNINVLSVKHGFIPDLIKEYIQANHYNDLKFRIYSGADRSKDYERQMKTRLTDIQYSIRRIGRDPIGISGTKCRQLLREDNYIGFRSMYNYPDGWCKELYELYKKYI